ncbi:MAG: zinc dependent phospholipase C family protein [Firmicutes bacterium]|nr:zinc dependent phospholipase C family protein [Bacillota bacterium]
MPFTMTHLIVAEKIAGRCPNLVSDLPQYYLGAIAPDAVHNRENYVSDFKKKSHLHSCGAEWGRCTSYDECAANAVAFLRGRENSGRRDFVYGYVIHELCDICNNIYVWQPFLKKYPEEWEKGYGNIDHREANLMDFWLYQTYGHRDEIWAALGKAEAFDFEGLVSGAEVERQRRIILYEWYGGSPEIDVSGNTLHTPETEFEFIDLAAGFAARKLGFADE